MQDPLVPQAILRVWSSPWKLHFQIRAAEHDHILHILHVPEPIGLPQNELDGVVGRLTLGAAEAELNRIEDVVLVSLDLLGQLLHGFKA